MTAQVQPCNLVRGGKVMIFEDPLTKEIPEGEATIIKVLHVDEFVFADNMKGHYCKVRFTDEPDTTFHRWVYA